MLCSAASSLSPALDLAFGAVWLVPSVLMCALVIRQRWQAAKRRKAAAVNPRTLAYHEALNAQRGLCSRRGHCLLEALAVLAFCLVWSALLIGLLACSEASDLAALFRP